MERLFDRVGIWGVGLIGGSLGMALKRAAPDMQITGLGRDRQRLSLAHRLGAIDSFESEPAAALRDRDLVILATPVEHILAIMPDLGKLLAPGTLVHDAGSTKRQICCRAWEMLPAHVEFIGGHPVAGREVTGVEHSVPGLFDAAPYVLCPRQDTTTKNLEKLKALVAAIGARPIVMTPEDHDRLIASVSHLPQLLSTALANVTPEAGKEIAGSGLRDMLRLAGSSYEVWRGIFQTNADNVEAALGVFLRRLESVRRQLRAGSLEEEFDRGARACREFRRETPADK